MRFRATDDRVTSEIAEEADAATSALGFRLPAVKGWTPSPIRLGVASRTENDFRV